MCRCLIAGVNDTQEDAANIARFIAPLGGLVMLNVIPYNPGSSTVYFRPAPRSSSHPAGGDVGSGMRALEMDLTGVAFEPPTEEGVLRFMGYLNDLQVPVVRRVTKGRDIAAACGQLGNKDLREQMQAKSREPAAGGRPE